MRMRGAYLTTHRRFQAHFAPHEVTADQFVLMTLLVEKEGVSQMDLVRRSWSDPNTIRAMLVLLEARGLIVRKMDAHDARARLVFLTSKGRKLQQDLWRGAGPLQQVLFETVRPEERTTVFRWLERVTEVMVPPGKSKGRKANSGG